MVEIAACFKNVFILLICALLVFKGLTAYNNGENRLQHLSTEQEYEIHEEKSTLLNKKTDLHQKNANKKPEDANNMVYKYYAPAKHDNEDNNKVCTSNPLLVEQNKDTKKCFPSSKSNLNSENKPQDLLYSNFFIQQNPKSLASLNELKTNLEKLVDYSLPEKKNEANKIKLEIIKNVKYFIYLKVKKIEEDLLQKVTRILISIEKNLLQVLHENKRLKEFPDQSLKYTTFPVDIYDFIITSNQLNHDLEDIFDLSSPAYQLEAVAIKDSISRRLSNLYKLLLESISPEPLKNKLEFVQLIDAQFLSKGWTQFKIDNFWFRFVRIKKSTNFFFYSMPENADSAQLNIDTTLEERANVIDDLTKYLLSHVYDTCSDFYLSEKEEILEALKNSDLYDESGNLEEEENSEVHSKKKKEN